MKRSGPLRRRTGLRRTPWIRPNSTLQRRKRLNPESQKHRDEREIRDIVRSHVLNRDGHRCQASGVVPNVGCVDVLDVHEVIPRSAWRDGYLDPTNCITVCRAHHDWIGDHPDEAHSLGLHGYSWERPVATCNSCDAPIVWARTEPRGEKPARNIPLDSDDGKRAGKHDDGNLIIVGSTAGRFGSVPVVRYVAKGPDKMRAHFVSCPNAGQHRKS